MPASDHSDPPYNACLGASQSLPRICFGDLGDPIAVRTLQGHGGVTRGKIRQLAILLAGVSQKELDLIREVDLECHLRAKMSTLSRSRPSLCPWREWASDT